MAEDARGGFDVEHGLKINGLREHGPRRVAAAKCAEDRSVGGLVGMEKFFEGFGRTVFGNGYGPANLLHAPKPSCTVRNTAEGRYSVMAQPV